MSEENHRRRQDDQWHVGKTVDLGHILTTIILVLSAFWFISDLNTRIAVVESKSADRDKIVDEIRVDIKEIKNLLWEMNQNGSNRSS
jgi:hypothetical protein